jgi:hypothetical protein
MKSNRNLPVEGVRYPHYSPSMAFLLDRLEVAKWSTRTILGFNRKLPKLPDVLKRHVIASYARLYKLGTFVESGTYLGGTVAFMRRYCRQVYSVEFQPRLAKAAQERFAGDPTIRLFEGDSSKLMPGIVAELREPSLFWLDGHFAPGTARDGEVACPTLGEISAVLADTRFAHVVLVDDACDFRGEGGYPTLSELRQFVLSARPSATLEVKDDIVRIICNRDARSSGA